MLRFYAICVVNNNYALTVYKAFCIAFHVVPSFKGTISWLKISVIYLFVANISNFFYWGGGGGGGNGMFVPPPTFYPTFIFST